MAKETITKLVCDICGSYSTSPEEQKKWVHWSQDHLFVDRMWIERCICPTCANDITVAIKNKK